MNSTIRRHHFNRLKKKRLQYRWGAPVHPKILNTPATCSCYMCGNPRKHWKRVTRQEVISNLYVKEIQKDYGQICNNCNTSPVTSWW